MRGQVHILQKNPAVRGVGGIVRVMIEGVVRVIGVDVRGSC